MLLITDCRRYDAPDAGRVDVRLHAGRIAEVGAALPPQPGEPRLDAAGCLLAPGLIDVHVHGAGGADVLDATPEALRTLAQTLARLGVTGFLGTTFMRPDLADRHLRVAAEYVGQDLGGARLLGLHVEGPFLNPAKRGGIPAETLYPPTPAALAQVLEATGGALRMMTIAPELEGSLRVIERLTAEGVVCSFGHSAASYEQTKAGLAAGIRHATHLYNAMPGLHHREPGPLVALYEEAGLAVQLISDDVHVNRHTARFTTQVFGAERICLITDGMRTVGLPDGRYRFGEREFESRDGVARYLDGTLIGTALGLLQIALRHREYTGGPLAAAIDSASAVPARVLGLEASKGRVAPGYDADLVLLHDDGRVRATLVGGAVVYDEE